MSKEQDKGIHDLVNNHGFAMHYRTISNTVSHLGVYDVRETIQQSKKAKIFQYGFLEEH